MQETERTFLLQCSNCYKTISSPTIRTLILKRTLIHEVNDSSLSTKNRAHLKLTRFVEREWQHQLLPANKVASIIKEIKRQIEPLNHPSIDALLSHYKTAVANLKCTNAFDEFYEAAIKIQTWFSLKSPLQEWLNVTMNGFMNRLLDDITWVNERKLTNRLSESQALLAWLNHLITDPSAIRSLLNQQIEQTESLDHAAWRCQHILRALEGLTPGTEYIRHTGMQKLLRVIVQNNSTITSTGEQKDREVPVKALCEYSSTMQHALWRVREKIPNADVVRPLEITWKGH